MGKLAKENKKRWEQKLDEADVSLKKINDKLDSKCKISENLSYKCLYRLNFLSAIDIPIKIIGV